MNQTEAALPPRLIKRSMGRYGEIQETDTGSYYSITTILGKTRPEESQQKILAAWHRKVELYGKSQAAEYAEADRNRGNAVHAALRQYAEERQLPSLEPQLQAFVDVLFPLMAGVAPGDFLSTEEYVCNPPAGYAGRLDARCLWGGKHTIWELKTSFRSMPKAWLEDKILQSAAEAEAFDWMYPANPVEQVMVVNAFAPSPESTSGVAAGLNCYLISGTELDEYKEKWSQRLELFRKVGADLLPTPARYF